MVALARVFRPAIVRRRFLSGRTFSTCGRIMAVSDASVPARELGVGEMEGTKFKIEPLKRTGEDETTLRARLLYQSRKRGMREGELLLSTFSAENLSDMSAVEMQEYDRFLDENDWDIYYWATQTEQIPSVQEGKGQEQFEPKPAQGEWAQTVGAFRPAYRPVPSRWKDSKILAKLREHVENKKPSGRSDGRPIGMSFVPDLKA